MPPRNSAIFSRAMKPSSSSQHFLASSLPFASTSSVSDPLRVMTCTLGRGGVDGNSLTVRAVSGKRPVVGDGRLNAFWGLMSDGSEVDATERCWTRSRCESVELDCDPKTSDG